MMESGVLKAVLLFLPVLAYIVWQIVSLHRDPELRQAPSRKAARDRGADDSDSLN